MLKFVTFLFSGSSSIGSFDEREEETGGGAMNDGSDGIMMESNFKRVKHC